MRSRKSRSRPAVSDQPRRRVGWARRRDRLDEVHDLLQRIDTALIVRDPGTARSADAYEGLRRQVVASACDRRKHIVQLTELAEALRRGDDPESLRSRAEEWLLQANVITVGDVAIVEAFEFTGEGDGAAKLLTPAYVDGATGSLIRRGLAERLPAAPTTTPSGLPPDDQCAVDAEPSVPPGSAIEEL